MKVVYLDQNKWIDLARAFHGRSPSPASKLALEAIVRAQATGSAVFPLSAIHYMETWKISQADRRARLGACMWAISMGYTLASYRNLLIHELEVALSTRFPHLVPRPFTLLGKGVNHAFGMEVSTFQLPEPLRSSLPPALRAKLEVQASDFIERAAITGEEPGGQVAPPFHHTTHNQAFLKHLTTLPSRLQGLTPAQQEAAILLISINDIVDPLNEVLLAHKLPPERLYQLDQDGLSALLKDIPSRAVDLHLHHQVAKNPRLKPKITDLEDWGGLAPAAASCDVVVCEKHMASMLLRDGFAPKARVTPDLADLPSLLSP